MNLVFICRVVFGLWCGFFVFLRNWVVEFVRVLRSYGVVNDVFVMPVNFNVLGVDATEFVPEQLRLILLCIVGSSVVLKGVAVCRRV